MKSNQILLTALAVCFFASCKKSISVEQEVPAEIKQATQVTTLSGGSIIQGVKWKNPMIEQDSAASAKFETQGLTYAEAAAGLAANNVKDVVLKVAEMKILPKGTTVAQRNNEIIDMLKALRTQGISVYIWERQWLQHDHVVDNGDEEFATEMADIINQAKSENIADALKGVALIENNLEECESVLSKALSIARKINNKTGNWLKNKSFFMPGAAMGAYFKKINSSPSSSTFFSNMNAEVHDFAFIYKHMKSQDTDKCSLGSLNDEWIANVSKSATTTVDQQVSFLRTTMGLSHLENYLTNNKGNYPRLCNVVFWGDSGDGVILMSRTNMQAVHQLLVTNNSWKDYFFDMTYCASTATGSDLSKYILQVSGSGTVTKNLSLNDAGTMAVYDEWNKWNWANPGY